MLARLVVVVLVAACGVSHRAGNPDGWKGKLFGFTESGEFITIDPTTGVGTLVASGGPAWWGAAVTTTAPIIF